MSGPVLVRGLFIAGAVSVLRAVFHDHHPPTRREA
jgi:hypothetical protein